MSNLTAVYTVLCEYTRIAYCHYMPNLFIDVY